MTAEEIIKNDKIKWWKTLLAELFDTIIVLPITAVLTLYPLLYLDKILQLKSDTIFQAFLIFSMIVASFLLVAFSLSLHGLRGQSPGDRIFGRIYLNKSTLKPINLKTAFLNFIMNTKLSPTYYKNPNIFSLKFLKKYEKYSDCIYKINYKTYQELKFKGLL